MINLSFAVNKCALIFQIALFAGYAATSFLYGAGGVLVLQVCTSSSCLVCAFKEQILITSRAKICIILMKLKQNNISHSSVSSKRYFRLTKNQRISLAVYNLIRKID